jgi:hypothetical protein
MKTMHSAAENILPSGDLMTDDEVKASMIETINDRYGEKYQIVEWNAVNVPMGFGRRFITCKFNLYEAKGE